LVVRGKEGERKFSGSAYREKKDRGFHHGTLLLGADLSRLANYLNPDPKKLQAKGITSVRSRVINLNEINPEISHDNVCQAIKEAFFEYYGETVESEYISPETLPDLPDFKEKFDKQSSWDWNFGKTPAFMHTLAERFSWGSVEVHLDIENAIIIRAKIFTDSLDPTPLETLANTLVDSPYKVADVIKVVKDISASFPAHAAELTELQDWLNTAVA